MARSTTLSIRVSPEVKEKLEQLAKVTRRTQSFIAGEAISAYVEYQQELATGVEEGIEDFRTGNTVSHEEAMRELWEIIEKHRKG